VFCNRRIACDDKIILTASAWAGLVIYETGASKGVIRVLIVHDFPVICNLVSAALKDIPDIEVVGCTASIQEAQELAECADIDVALVSIRLPEQGALKITTALAQADPQVKVLVFGLNEQRDQILPYIESGAAGYIQNNTCSNKPTKRS
jgi:DNA-binding NarL/FixJ family response regulator